MPAGSLCCHVGAVLFGGVQCFFYTSTPTDAATNPRLMSRTGGPSAHLTRPAWHRVERLPTSAADPDAGRSAGSCVRTDGSAAPACPAPETADVPGAQPPHSNRRTPRSGGCLCLGRKALECAGAPAQEWLAYPNPAMPFTPSKATCFMETL